MLTAEAVAEFMGTRSALRPKTQEEYRRHLALFERAFKTLPETAPPVQSWLNSFKLAPETVHTRFVIIKALYRHIHLWHPEVPDPMLLVRPPRVPPDVLQVDAGAMDPNPYQPETRREVPEDIAEQYGRSILQHGLIQSPVLRAVDDHYQVADGWLRRAGIVWLAANDLRKDTLIPVVVRELTDQQMADMVMEANTVRLDLNPVELANLYRRYLEDFAVTQTDLAKSHNCSQGEIANTVRLLELPVEAQQAIISHEITATHARQLLRMNRWPDIQAEMLARCVRQRISADALGTEIATWRWHNSRAIATAKGQNDLMPHFNRKACEACDWREVFGNPWRGDLEKHARCLNLTCYDEKDATALKAADEKRIAKAAAGGAEDKVYTDKELPYGKYEDLVDGMGRAARLDKPEECTSCQKRGKRRLYDDKLRDVCLDPTCFRRKKTARSRADNRRKKGVDKDLTARIGLMVDKAYNHEVVVLQEAAIRLTRDLRAPALADLAAQVEELPKHDNGRVQRDHVAKYIRGLNKRAVLQIMAATIFAISRRADFSDAGHSTRIPEDTKYLAAVLDGKVEDHQSEVRTWQVEYCRGCSWADQDKIGQDLDRADSACGCPHHQESSIGDDGTCRDRHKKEEKVERRPDGTPAIPSTSAGVSAEEEVPVAAQEEKVERRPDGTPAIPSRSAAAQEETQEN